MRKATGLILLSMVQTAFGQNLIVNGGFEKGMSGWLEHFNGEVRARGRIDRTERHSGKMSFHLTNASDFKAQVYYRIFQRQTVKPRTTYLIGAWSKGVGVGKCWIGGGLPTDWHIKRQFPAGDYDWKWSAIEYTTGPDQTVFELMILSESPTRDLWVDDVYMAPIDKTLPGLFYEPTVRKGLPPEARFYPALPIAERTQSPAIKVRLKEDPSFGFDARINWDADDLILEVDVLDPTASPICPGKDLWHSDSIQIGLDTQPEKPKDGFTADCYELGFALDPSNKIVQYAWYAGGVDAVHWPDLPAYGRRTATGWQVTIHVPWKRLRLASAELPKVLGLNILVNDGGGKSGRRWVEWTYGLGWGIKTSVRFARVVRVNTPDCAAYCIFEAKPVYDKKDWMIGHFVEYTFKVKPAESVDIVCGSNESKPMFDWGTASLSPAPAGSTRSFDFLLPLAALNNEGRYRILATTGPGRVAEVPFIRANLSVRMADLLKSNETRVHRIKGRIKDLPSNGYVEMGLTIADRFIQRVKPDASGKDKQSIDWSMRQMTEVAGVLDETEKFLATKTTFDSPRLTGGAVEIRDGVFYTQTTAGKRPFYFGGFGHFGLAQAEMPLLRKMGYNAIEFEAGPAQFGAHSESCINTVKLASENRMKIFFMLSPHYFPQWAIDKAPDVIVPGGFNKFDVNHPVAREAIGKWIDHIVGQTKNEPSILSYDLMNEPIYTQSGRTRYSQPVWIRFLQDRHKTIDTLNALYGTKYTAFDQVPVPKDEYPRAVGDRRAYYDWFTFNHRNFADWIRFMHDRVKKVSPRAFTQVKVFDVSLHWSGIDPELICEITDIAGNDCWSLWPGGDYAYSWLQMELYYDLLHSFRGRPVANTENHIFPDGSTVGDDFPPAHTYAVYWQGALHHQGAQVTWVWEEPVNVTFEGHISLRPANIHAGAKAMLDLNRLAEEITAVNQARPQVALLYSVPSIFWEKDFEETTRKVYTAVNFLGLKITFISERQLAAGKMPPVTCVILPHATHVLDSTVAALDRFVQKGGTLILVGQKNLGHDEYHRTRTQPPALAKITATEVKELPGILKALPQVTLMDIETHQPAWGVEFRAVPYRNHRLVPMVNLLPRPITVQLSTPGPTLDLITGRTIDPARISLAPMECLLLENTP
jgi:hypothetical protein